jgi:hypothetical protein
MVGQRSVDLRDCRVGAALRQRRCLHDHAFDAMTALHGLFVNQSALERVRPRRIAAPIDEATFNRSRVTSLDCFVPIIRFLDIPDEIDIVLANRPDLPPIGVRGPASETNWPAIANAIHDPVGMRLRRLPFTPSRLLAALNSG